MGAKMGLLVLLLTLAVLLSTTPDQASSLTSYQWLKIPLRTPSLWQAADLVKRLVKRSENTHDVPMEKSPTRFQRGVHPGDEGRVADMRMIFDELKREMKAAIEEKEETRTEWPETEQAGPGSTFHVKHPSPYKYFYKRYLL